MGASEVTASWDPEASAVFIAGLGASTDPVRGEEWLRGEGSAMRGNEIVGMWATGAHLTWVGRQIVACSSMTPESELGFCPLARD